MLLLVHHCHLVHNTDICSTHCTLFVSAASFSFAASNSLLSLASTADRSYKINN